MTTAVTWLHVSDFHFRASGDTFAQEQVIASLLDSISRAVQELEHSLTFAVVTGDIAFSGQPAEYEAARSFFEDLVTVADLDASRFYFVPGNHDVDRSIGELAYYGARSRIDSPARVDYYLGAAKEIAQLIERQAAFWSFVDEFTVGQQRICTHDGLGYVAKLSVNRPTICLLGLNSAWLSGVDDRERSLVMGERHMINAVDTARDLNPQLVIALAHHPVSCLTEWDALCCNTRILTAADMYLRGHLHTHQVLLSSTPEAPCIEIAAGASYTTRFYGNSYNIGELDPSKGSCKVQHYRYLPDNACFEASEPDHADIRFGGSIPGTRADLVRAITLGVPSAAPFGEFIAGLVTGELSEVPVFVDGTVRFVTPASVSAFTDQQGLASMEAVLGLQNILRLYDAATSLEIRVAENAETISQYASAMHSMISIDPSCETRLTGMQPGQQLSVAEREITTEREASTWSEALLDDLRQSADWMELEQVARRLVASSTARVARAAKSALVEALMRSDEQEKRDEACFIASELASTADASDRDLLLAAAAAEARGDDLEALRRARRALQTGHHSPDLIDYARRLSTRTGSRDLREIAENASSLLMNRGRE